VGRYEVLLPIASGGMATVYLARARGAEGFEREVALKLVHDHLRREPAFLRDLIEEAKIAGRIRHPNVVPVLDVGEEPSGTYLVMEYVEGASLSGLFRAAADSGMRLPRGVTLRILLDALSGLHAAHELRDSKGQLLSVVHRDFSPQNILVGTDGLARLTDFGIAKAASRISHTRTGVTRGKLAYMSPEQSRGRPLDRRADVWAAGVVAWEIIARRRLFKGDEATVLLDLARKPIPRLRELDPEIPAELDEAVANALVRDRDQRTPTAKALRDALAAGARGQWTVADTEEVATTVTSLVSETLSARRERSAGAASSREDASAVTVPLQAEPSLTPSETPSAGPSEPPKLPLAAAGPRVTAVPGRARRVGTALALLATLIAGVGAGVVLEKRSATRQLGADPAAVAPIRSAFAGPAPSVSAEPEPASPIAPAPAPVASAPALVPLVIESNLAIRVVQVDGLPASIEAGSKRVELSVTSGPHQLEVTTTSGRRQRATFSGRNPVKLSFAVGSGPRPLVENPY